MLSITLPTAIRQILYFVFRIYTKVSECASKREHEREQTKRVVGARITNYLTYLVVCVYVCFVHVFRKYRMNFGLGNFDDHTHGTNSLFANHRPPPNSIAPELNNQGDFPVGGSGPAYQPPATDPLVDWDDGMMLDEGENDEQEDNRVGGMDEGLGSVSNSGGNMLGVGDGLNWQAVRLAEARRAVSQMNSRTPLLKAGIDHLIHNVAFGGVQFTHSQHPIHKHICIELERIWGDFARHLLQELIFYGLAVVCFQPCHILGMRPHIVELGGLLMRMRTNSWGAVEYDIQHPGLGGEMDALVLHQSAPDIHGHLRSELTVLLTDFRIYTRQLALWAREREHLDRKIIYMEHQRRFQREGLRPHADVADGEFDFFLDNEEGADGPANEQRGKNSSNQEFEAATDAVIPLRMGVEFNTILQNYHVTVPHRMRIVIPPQQRVIYNLANIDQRWDARVASLWGSERVERMTPAWLAFLEQHLQYLVNYVYADAEARMDVLQAATTIITQKRAAAAPPSTSATDAPANASVEAQADALVATQERPHSPCPSSPSREDSLDTVLTSRPNSPVLPSDPNNNQQIRLQRGAGQGEGRQQRQPFGGNHGDAGDAEAERNEGGEGGDKDQGCSEYQTIGRENIANGNGLKIRLIGINNQITPVDGGQSSHDDFARD